MGRRLTEFGTRVPSRGRAVEQALDIEADLRTPGFDFQRFTAYLETSLGIETDMDTYWNRYREQSGTRKHDMEARSTRGGRALQALRTRPPHIRTTTGM